MRIRKHAKVSPLTYAAAAASSIKPGAVKLPTRICQLNQSPWDVITFPIEDESSPSSPHPAAPPPHLFLLQSGGCGGTRPLPDSNGAVQSSGLTAAVLCSKTDGKAWQCKREAKSGGALCDHHLEQIKHYNNLARPAAGNQTLAPTGKNSRPRPKKTHSASSSSSNQQQDLYYYTGFGPLWGKKRGPGRARYNNTDLPNTSHHDPSHGVEDEFDSEDDEEDGVGKKEKVRKPIKARSLKSIIM
ncbi:hypothetical protein DM860_009036 [Cuscuta australis]|uniref:WRC domain-containing protein n=1 Tax=Cuscuta australis TaxID=267555 RepID=A0A328D8S8_9ASTE|nr:hypothetical protein DM860_009036 [Cuscuta australis]